MPRGRRMTDYEGKLAQIEEKIKKHKANIATLEAQKQRILDIQQQADSDKLMDYLERTGMSISDAIAKLESQN